MKIARLSGGMDGIQSSYYPGSWRVGVRFLYKLGQPPKTLISFLSAIYRERLLRRVSYSFHILVHAICVVCIRTKTTLFLGLKKLFVSCKTTLTSFYSNKIPILKIFPPSQLLINVKYVHKTHIFDQKK